MLLEEFLKPLGVTQTQFAERIGGRRGVTPDTALRLEKALGMSAQFWLNLQLACDLYHAMHSPEAAKIEKIEPLLAAAQ
jgi:addiction module HigA family antidote